MDIFKKMQELVHLTPNEICIRDAIIQDPEDFLRSRPKEMAQKHHVSLATLYRLVNKLELDGIQSLKLAVASAYKQRPHPHVENFDFPILPTDTHYQVMLHLKEVYEKTIDQTLDLFNPDVLVKVAGYMRKASCIDIYTTSANYFFAKNFQFQMMEINARVEVPVEEYHMHLYAANSDRTHLAFIISFGGRGAIVHDIARLLHKKNTPIILITSTKENSLKAYADACIYMSSFENHYEKISSFSTRMTLLYILDTLYAIYFKQNYEQNIQNKLNTYRFMTSKEE